MTQKEAIAVLEESKRQNEVMRDNPSTFWASHQMADGVKNAERRIAALDMALTALRPVSRERVEKARWIKIYEDGEPAIEQHQIGVACSKCMNMPKDRFTESKFCPNCGRPMTGEAVQMVMERLEALYGKAD